MKLFAFWKYDLFPFVTGHKVEEILANGSVKSCGGYVFKPILILPLEEGLKKMAELDALTAEFRAESEKLNKIYTEKAKKILP